MKTTSKREKSGDRIRIEESKKKYKESSENYVSDNS